jgi:hypothetical protein
MSARRIALAAAALGTTAALAAAGAGVALPPAGTADDPGTPAGSMTITTPAVAQKGDVGFCVANIRVDTSGGPVAQPFMVKFDDHGSYGIGPFTPDADGSLCATVSTDPARYATAKGGAADKIPADLCDPTKEHWLRLLSGSWAHPDASQRSIAQTFTVTGRCGDVAGGGTTTTPGGGGTTTTPGGGTTTTPGTGAPTTGGTPTTAAAPFTLRSAALATDARRVTLKVRGGTAFARGTLVLRTRAKVALGRSAPARRTLARGGFQVAARDAVTVRLTLTAAARSLLRTRATVAATLAVTPAGAKTINKNVTVRRPRRS